MESKDMMKMILEKAPMGWNSYDYYSTTVTEEQVRENADYMAAYLKEYGWEYVVIDIQWYAKDAGQMKEQFQYIPFGDMEMDAYGRYQPAVNRFPSAAEGRGFRPLADYIHGLGLKFGIHIMRGIPRLAAHQHLPVMGTVFTAAQAANPASICGWNTDMYGVRDNEAGQAYYDSLIRMYAEWGVDYIKCDDICDSWLYRNDSFGGWHEMRMLHEAIERSGRDIVLSLSPGPAHIERAWQYERYANMWRITDDFWDRWELLKNMFERCELWQNHVENGSYPDCDMLPLGKLGKGFGHEWNTNFTKEEQKTMMTLWCVFGSPLMLGTELTKLDDWTKWLLTRKEILKLTKGEYVGKQVERNEELAIWSCRGKETKEKYLAFFNLSEEEKIISCDCGQIRQFVGENAETAETTAAELWSGEKVLVEEGILHSLVPPHGTKLFQLQ